MEDIKELRDKARGGSLIDILNRALPDDYCHDETPRVRVAQRTLDLLASIHNAFVVEPDSQWTAKPSPGKGHDPSLEDARRRRALHALLDLLSFEGIYPSLSDGVGIPLEKRVISVLPAGVITKQARSTDSSMPRDEQLLDRILGSVNRILEDNRSSIQPIILGRILPDIICGTAELAFNSTHLTSIEVEAYKRMFNNVIKKCSTPSLLPALSSLLQASTAAWFKTHISSQLSRVPLRKDGVFQTILFLASQFAPSLGQSTEDLPSGGPPITVQAIMQSSRLLSSVPQGMATDEYFSNIAPKLLALLDGKDPDMKRAASYIIGNGILSKRAYGAPGTVGFTIFVQPIFDTLNGRVTPAVTTWLKEFFLDGSSALEEMTKSLDESIVIPERKLLLALDRLAAFTLLHPNPGLLKRLVNPVLLPLWGLQYYSRVHQKRWWDEKVTSLLTTFFSVSTSNTRLIKLADNISWDGSPAWTYGPGEEGGVSIRRRKKDGLGQASISEALESLDKRVDNYLELLATDPQKDEFAGDVFLHVSRQWLLGDSRDEDSEMQLQKGDNLRPGLLKLVSAKIAEKLLNQFKESLSRHPTKVLELIKLLIESEMNYIARKSKGETTRRDNISLESLGNIVETATDTRQGQLISDLPEGSETLLPAFSLLSTILTSPDFQMSDSILSILQSLKLDIDSLLPNLPSALMQPATTSSMLLEITLSNLQSGQVRSPPTSSRTSDFEMHRQAINDISSPLAPVQAEGLSILDELIEKASPVLDIPATLTLLLSMLTSNDESMASDEFVYLNVIKIIGSLASKHPRTVVKTLAERYADRSEESTLDQRLKIGEALLRTVEGLEDALVGETAKILGETMIEVAGRRGVKPKAKEERGKKVVKGRTNKEAMDESKFIPMDQVDEDMDSETEDPAKEAYSGKILEAWAAGVTADTAPDDLRARASAISILASAVQTNLPGLGPAIAASSIDLAISILNLESSDGSAILRRAAVILLLDLIKALDQAKESGKDLGFGFSLTSPSSSMHYPSTQHAVSQQTTIGNIPHILRVLNFVESKETDAIVRGHLRALIESLEAWLEKSLLWGIRTQRGIMEEPRIELGDRLAGLCVDPMSRAKGKDGKGAHPRIEEIE
ncbi:hypothetical protein PRK78_002346 [Emydomyces testavorans]|uniref:RNA polymerase II assembly factor Rtp1 C-terminal domain-containing protein n=1 Tax=Emydomyces testavorans TaxID=2070801 RepID=A0AAF0DE53_9EURO|nr:hypothetical protein PRK78_002346 [Emydomyces testavorans]